MDIAWSEFTPLASFAGGAMIGAAALLLMLLNGRVMGMSGILTGLIVGHAYRLWRLAFVAGVIIAALGAGIVFGVGLALAGILNPSKVVGFLDIFGAWDPSLGLVMAGGILVNATGHYLVMKRKKPVFETKFDLPLSQIIDRPLVLGSVIFGIGWGLAGLCPGPVVASLLLQPVDMLQFLALLIAGGFAGRWLRA
mgnify:CR=1 FL=1